MKKTRLVIEMKGGLIQSMAADDDVEVVILDGDIEGADDTAMIRLPAWGSSKEEVVEVFRPGIANPDLIDFPYVEEIFKQVKAC